jgi:outer membrane protein OmpA-like peptidoglycan-associated protein
VRIQGTIVTAILGLTLAAACGGNTPPPKSPAEPSPPEKPTETVVASPNIAVSMDIAQACNITGEKHIDPRFSYNHDELLADDRVVLDTIAKCIADGALKGRTVSLIGRTDPRGTDEYNLALGSRRSRAVSDYIHGHGHGIKASQILETTRGAIDATGTDEAGWTNDRRVDIELVNQKTASRE